MKKTLIALAALAATASFAQVTISGRAALGVGTYSATGATAGATSDVAARTLVQDFSSRLRFAVNEDLGGGLRAFAAYEFGFAYDTGTANGQNGISPANSVAGTTANGNTAIGFGGSRESHIGIGNALMEVRLGRQNVYWTQGDLSDVGANFIGKDAFSDLYTRIGSSTRQNNAILLNLNQTAFAGSQVYWAPEVSAESAPVGSPNATSSNNASTWGARVNWDQGNVRVMADYQKRTNIGTDIPALFVTDVTASDITSIKLGAGYRYAAGSMVSVHYWDMKKDIVDAATNATALSISGTGAQQGGGWKQTGYGVNLKHNLGNGLTAFALYGVLNNVNATAAAADLADSGTRTYTLGLRKDLSKRTGIFTSYGRVDNADNGTHSPTGGGFVPATTRAGSDPTFFLVGMQHNF